MTDGTTHLDLDALADAMTGEGDAGDAAHLTSCASCASRLAELEAAQADVLAALAQLPDPPLPDGLADRLSTALAAEPPPAAPAEPPLAAPAGVTALPSRASQRRWLPAAAAAVLLVSGGGLGYALLQGGAGGGDEASSAAGAAADAGGAVLPTSSSGTDYADTAAVTSALPSVLAGNVEAFALDSAAGTTMAKTEPESSAVAEGSRSAQLPAPQVAAAPVDALARLRTPEGLADCLRAVLPPEEPDLQPLALDYAQYQGQPALAVVLPDPDPEFVSVFVVGPDCTAADAKVLGFVRLDAP